MVLAEERDGRKAELVLHWRRAGCQAARRRRWRAGLEGPRPGRPCTVLTPIHSTLILTSSPPSGPLSYLTTSALRLSRLLRFSVFSGSFSTSATLCLCTLSRPWEPWGRRFAPLARKAQEGLPRPLKLY